MGFNVIEWFVIAFSILAIVKLLFVVFNPKAWFKVVKSLYSKGNLLFLVELILAFVLFYYLSMQISIVQIVAGLVLGALLTGMSFAVFSKDTIAWGDKILKTKNILSKVWIPALLWLALSIWALSQLM